MTTQYKLGQTFKPKDNEFAQQLDMMNEYAVVIQEKSAQKNLILMVINSRKNSVEKTNPFYKTPDYYFQEAEINAMDLLHDEICIKEHKTGTLIYGEAVLLKGDTCMITFKPVGADLIANVQFTIKTISGQLLDGFLYYSLQPKNYFL
jgi:hypothetical protein